MKFTLTIKMNQIREKLSQLTRVTSSGKFQTAVCFLLIAFGAFLRIHQYLDNRSLWLDEAMLSLNIVNRSFPELLQPLDYRQNAPIAFLMLERLSVEVFGGSEYALRLPSLIFGLLSIPLFYQVSKRYLNSNAVTLALGFFAISNPLIYYSSEVKQYAADVVASLLILLVIHELQTRKLSLTKTIIYSIAVASLIWFSFPAIFVLAGGVVCLILFYGKIRHSQEILPIIVVYTTGLLSFSILYNLFLAKPAGNEALKRSWEWKGGFAPVPIFDPISDTIKWYIETFNNIFISPVGFAAPGLAGVLFLAGCFLLIRENKYKLSLLLSPIFVTLVASAIQKYPFATLTYYEQGQGGRLILFLVPAIIMLVAEGVEYLRTKIDKNVVVLIIVILLLQPSITSLRYLKNPRVVEEVRPVIEYVLKNQEDADIIYLFYRTKYQFKYYQDILGIKKPNNVVRGLRASKRQRVKKYVEQLKNFRGNQRVWFVFSYILSRQKDEKDFFVTQLEITGIQVKKIEMPGASAYLYDLSE